ncbi:MAG: VWA domain-containing protein [Deltaproteobacteria bacterium]|nr:VWA domain-containing protein [Deltaproteobacteria bacterium]
MSAHPLPALSPRLLGALGALGAFTALSGTGCQDYLFEQKCRETIKEAELKQPAVKPTPADILFVVDNSGSMADEQENLALNFDAFIRNIAGSGDYQIAVVTTDQDEGSKEKAGVRTHQFTAQNPPAEWTSDDSTTACGPIEIEHACFRGPNASLRIVSSSMSSDEQKTVFADNVRVGSCGSGTEQGLAAMLAALEKSSGCNSGFLRDEANLVVIFVSDENDSSSKSVDSFVDAIATFKPGGYAQIRVASIVGSVDGDASRCRVNGNGVTAECGSLCDECGVPSQPAWCASVRPTLWGFCDFCSQYNVDGCCSALAGGRYVEFTKKVEQKIAAADPGIQARGCQSGDGEAAGCLIASICQASFADTLERIATELVVSTSFTLDPPAVFPEGVSVALKNGRFPAEGKKLVYGTDYAVTADGRVLRLLSVVPQEGEDIDIQFVVGREDSTGEPRGACP